MIQRKVCMLGTLGVGKTSLVRRFVESIFSDSYKTTVGVKIDKKIVHVDGVEVALLLWDLEGMDVFNELQLSHLRGAAGLIFVVDGTRPNSLEQALDIEKRTHAALGDVPGIIVFNKHDLSDQWCIDQDMVHDLEARGGEVVITSAKTGENVDVMFQGLAQRMVSHV